MIPSGSNLVICGARYLTNVKDGFPIWKEREDEVKDGEKGEMREERYEGKKSGTEKGVRVVDTQWPRASKIRRREGREVKKEKWREEMREGNGYAMASRASFHRDFPNRPRNQPPMAILPLLSMIKV